MQLAKSKMKSLSARGTAVDDIKKIKDDLDVTKHM